MGTRNVTVVLYNQDVKIAQYGQWDGYPKGQGLTLLNFLSDSSLREQLRQILPNVRFQNEEDRKKQEKFLQSIGCKEGWMNQKQEKCFQKEYPLHHRDVGGDILQELLKYKDHPEIVLINSYEFAADSLWCEWAYVVDLDINVFEVYQGFNNSELTPEDRFYPLSQQENSYKPVRLIQTFSLEDLPSEDEFVRRCTTR